MLTQERVKKSKKDAKNLMPFIYLFFLIFMEGRAPTMSENMPFTLK